MIQIDTVHCSESTRTGAVLPASTAAAGMGSTAWLLLVAASEMVIGPVKA